MTVRKLDAKAKSTKINKKKSSDQNPIHIPVLHTCYTHLFLPHHILHYTSCFIPTSWCPTSFASLLPTLKSVLYDMNVLGEDVSFTHPSLDIIAWLPYSIGHFTIPFVVTAFLWLFRTKQALHFWAHTFRYMNMVGIIIQILLPCSALWYELICSLTPANYSTKGSPGGLALTPSSTPMCTPSHSPMDPYHLGHSPLFTPAAQPPKPSVYPTFSQPPQNTCGPTQVCCIGLQCTYHITTSLMLWEAHA